MRCNKVKNPCKICFQPTTKKTGLQCQGACHKWAHYKCLNYTPGKIQDIKSGAIKITCPCPDCSTTLPKEILTNPPFTCTNTQCPANKLPVCSSVECPKNPDNPIPKFPTPPVECSPSPSVHARLSPPRSPVPPPPRPARAPCPAASTSPCPNRQKTSYFPEQSLSCTNLSRQTSFSKECDAARAIASDTQVSANMDQNSIYSCIENLCTTVGLLSDQLKDLMCRMKEQI